MREGNRNAQFDRQWRALWMAPTVLPNIPNDFWVRLLGLNWASTALLMQLLTTLPCWLFLSGLLWWKRVSGQEGNTVSVVYIWLVIASVCLGLVWMAFYYGSVWSTWQGFSLMGVNTPAASDVLIAVLRWSITLMPLFLGALLCGLIGARRQRKLWRAFNETQNNFLLCPAWRRGVWLLLFALILIACAAACWQEVAGLPRLKTPYFFSDPIAWIEYFLTSPHFVLNLMLFALAWWIFSGVWLMPKEARPWAGENLKWYRQSLGMALVGGSALYLILLLVSLQVRRPAEAAFNNVMQRGEMAVLRSTMQTQS